MIAVLAAAVIFAVVVGGLLRAVMAREGKKEIVTVSALEKIVNVSELSTFTAVYNGIAQVMDEKKRTMSTTTFHMRQRLTLESILRK